MGEVTRVLIDIQNGNPVAAEKLLPLIYDELRKLAVFKMSRESPDQTLQPTALVHEAYLRLVDSNLEKRWDSPGHFFAAAAEAMRRILVDNARRRLSLRHGGGIDHKAVDVLAIEAPEPDEKLLAVSEAVQKLSVTDATAAELVKLRYFAGLTGKEAAESLGLSERTADRIWVYARSWLLKELQGA